MGPFGAKTGPFGAKTGPIGGPRGPEEAKYQVKVSGYHDSNPVRPIGSSWDQIWSPGALRVPMRLPKGPFGAKAGPFGGPGVPYRSVKGPKDVIWMRTTQIHCVEQFWPDWAITRAQKGAKRGPGPEISFLAP